MYKKLIALAVFCGCFTIANSQTNEVAKTQKYLINKAFNDIYTQNLKPATFGNEYGGPTRTLLASDLIANFVIVNTPKLPFYVVATPEISIRLLSEQGSPVKTPSYMPGLIVYFSVNTDAYKSRFFSIAYNHHSNGVEGPTFNANGTLNIDSGKFTTNFYTLMFHMGKRTDKDKVIINSYLSAGTELHAGLVGKGHAAGLDGRYGWVRLKGRWLYSLAKKYNNSINPDKKDYCDWMRLQFDLQYIADKYDSYAFGDVKKRLNAGLRYYYQLPFMQNTAIMAGGGYRGQDEYNIRYQDSYAYFTFGIAAGLSFGARR
ncbi:hypothetical protein [Mucilaginibacter antarcticus]|uniref:Phosphatidylcholine 1-acylhydrolase n=1 Tax=Mucilaginibacter antarcticus TaxID=1855725 RepID=A0ABW5XSI5_9SPHI